MASCEKAQTCPFFADRMGYAPAIAEMMKKRFCLGDKTECARYRVSRSGIQVPADLFPNQAARANGILAPQGWPGGPPR